MKYSISCFTRVRTGWLEWNERFHLEYANSEDELQILIEIIKEDESICRAFYEDLATHKTIFIKL